MAYVGKIKVPNEWATLASLIQAQIDGQSSFAFQSGKTYSIQVESGSLRVCNTSSTPTDSVDGEHLDEHQIGIYEPDGTNALYAKTKTKEGVVLVSVSELA